MTSEKQIRNRKSYKMFKKFLNTGCDKKVLYLLHQELDDRRAYGSQTASLYARESLDLIIEDYQL